MMRHEDMAAGMGWMHWAGGLFWLLVLIAVVLAIAALAKYLFGSRHDR